MSYVRQAVVLAGGLGTRLGALTETTPKPLLPVAGRPFLDYLVEWLARAGIEEVVISTGYLAGAFGSFIAAGNWRDPYGRAIRVCEAREDSPAGTAGALWLMRERLDERFLLVNGDSFFLCDPVRTAMAAEALPLRHMVLTVRPVPDTARYGRVELDDGGRVLRFTEKGVGGAGVINAGLSVLDRSVLDLIPSVPCSIEQVVYPRLAAEGRLSAVAQQGYFIDIGTPETYAAAQTELPAATGRPAVFFDRDGVLNVDDGYTHRIEDLVLLPGAAEAVAAARRAGFKTVVVTNQAGVARGLYDEGAVEDFHRALNRRLRASGGWIDAFYYCPYHPQGTREGYRGDHPDRKPNPGMLLRAAQDLRLDLARSLLVGDKPSDIAAAEAAGVRGFLYTDGPLDDFLSRLLPSPQ